MQFNPGDLFKTQSLIIRREVIGNRYLKYISVTILLKQLDYTLKICTRRYKKGKKHSAAPRASLCTSLVFFKFPRAYITQQCSRMRFLFL